MYDAYKPLRNRLRKANLVGGLQAVWQLYAYLSSRAPLPASLTPLGFRHGDPLDIQQWQLLLLARELLINASPDSKEQFTWYTLACALNEMRDIQEAISKKRYNDENGPDLAWWDFHAIAHQQIPLQRKQNVQRMLRFARIFGTDTLDRILDQKVGLTFFECVLLSFICVGNFERQGLMRKDQIYDEFGISRERIQRFYEWISASPMQLKTDFLNLQTFNHNWAYTFNALELKPLVTLGYGPREAVVSPIPSLIWNRLGTAIFFDLFKERGFTDAYGDAYEEHVGEFAQSVLTGPIFCVKGESVYKVGKKSKDGFDWYISDHRANLLIECKTKRVKLAAKMFDKDALLEDLNVLAAAVVQLYKNALDLRRGNTKIRYNGKKSYLAVVTLEDWYLISTTAIEALREMVLTRLADNGINIDVVDDMPYSVMSCDEYERMICAVRMLGIDSVLAGKFTDENRHMPVEAFLHKYAVEIQASFNETYGPPWKALMKRMTQGWSPDHRDKVAVDFTTR